MEGRCLRGWEWCVRGMNSGSITRPVGGLTGGSCPPRGMSPASVGRGSVWTVLFRRMQIIVGGQFDTPLLRFQGERLVLNINCGGMGEAWVEIQDEEGRPVPGFEMDRCDPIDRNFVAYPVTWRNDPDVSSLQGRWVRLRFRMRLAKLYAFQFTGAGEVENDRRAVDG